jgi:hypothetical protein
MLQAASIQEASQRLCSTSTGAVRGLVRCGVAVVPGPSFFEEIEWIAVHACM